MIKFSITKNNYKLNLSKVAKSKYHVITKKNYRGVEQSGSSSGS